jgi:hypothetical protein
MTVGPDEFMLLAFANLDLAKEVPAVSRARLNKEGKLGFPAEPYRPGVIVPGLSWHFNITTFWTPERGAIFYARLDRAANTRVIVLDDIGDHPKSKISFDAFNSRSPQHLPRAGACGDAKPMNHAHPTLSDEDVRRIADSLPASAKPKRVQAMKCILREWSRVELPDHLSRRSLRLEWKQTNQTLMKIEKHAQELLQEIEALDGFSDILTTLAAARFRQHKPTSTGRDEEDRAERRVDEGLTFLRTLSTLASKPKRGQPPNITAYLVILDAVAMFEWASRKRAAREVDRMTGKETGPFREFLEALWPVVFGNGIYGLQAAMRRWEEARTKYDEKSPLIANIRMRARAGRLTGL